MEDSAPEIDPRSLISTEQTEDTDGIRRMTTEEWILASPLSSPSYAAVVEVASSPGIFESEYTFQSPLHYDTENFCEHVDFELKPGVPPPNDNDGVASVVANTELSGDACFSDEDEACFSDEGDTVQSEDENAEVPCCSRSKEFIDESNDGKNYVDLDFEKCRTHAPVIIELASASQSSNSEVHQNHQDHDYELVKTSVDEYALPDAPSQDISDVPSFCLSQNPPSVSDFKSISEKQTVNSKIQSGSNPKVISSENNLNVYSEDDLTLNQYNAANDVHTDFFKAFQVQESETSPHLQSILNEIHQGSMGYSFEHSRESYGSETTSTASSESSDSELAEISGSENEDILSNIESQHLRNIPIACVNKNSTAFEFESTGEKNMVNSELQSDNEEGTTAEISVTIFDTIEKLITSVSHTATGQNVKNSEIRGRDIEENTGVGSTSSETERTLQNINEDFGNIKVSEIYKLEVTNKQNVTNSETQENNNEGNTCIGNISRTEVEIDSETIAAILKTKKDSVNSGYNTDMKSETQNTKEENNSVENILSPSKKTLQENVIQNLGAIESEAIEESGTANEQNIINFEMEMQSQIKEENSIEIISETSVTCEPEIINNENIEESKTQDGNEENICIENTPSTDMETASGNFTENSGTRSEIGHVDPIKQEQKEDHSISDKEAITDMDKNQEKAGYQEISSHSIHSVENIITDCKSEISNSKNHVSSPCCINCKKPYFDLSSATTREYTVQPVVILNPLLDLLEIDSNLSRMILLALSSEFKENGVTQTELLEYLRERKFPGTIAQLKLDIQKFFTAADGVNIIFKKNKRQFLNVTPVIKGQSDVEENKPVTTRKRKNENDLENVQDLPKRAAKSQKSETSTHSNAAAENKSKVTKDGKITKDKQITDPKLTKKHKQPPLRTKDGKSENETHKVKTPRKRKVADVVQEVLVKKRRRII